MNPDNGKIQPLAPEAQQVLNAERRHQSAPDAAKARVRARLAVTLGLPLPGSQAHAAPPAPAPSVAGAGSAAGVVAKVVGPVVLASLLLGGVINQRRAAAPLPRAPVAAMAEPAPLPAVTPVEAPPTAAPDTVITTTPPVRRADPAPRKSAPAAREDTLARERALLDEARGHLAAGRHARALEALELHGEKHAGGQLAEERDALTILALHQMGRVAEAERHAVVFRRIHANSIFLPGVDATLGSGGRAP